MVTPTPLPTLKRFGFYMLYVVCDLFIGQIPVRGRQTRMIRLRNPWGNEQEWLGAWSDKSKEWKMLSNDERKEYGITFANDGEFW